MPSSRGVVAVRRLIDGAGRHRALSVAEPPPLPGPGRRRPGGRTQEVTNRIFGATVTLLEREGYGGLTYQELAELAGVSRSTIYRRWPNPAELALDAMNATVRAHVGFPDTGTLEGDLRATLGQVADFISSRLGSALMAAGLEIRLTNSAKSTAGERWAERVLEVAPLFERALARGEIAADFDWELAFAAASGALYFRTLVMGRPIDRAWIERIVADFVQRAAKNQPRR
ncbi:MAG: hypothetical protein DI570_14745 [Phenylobacterium zucineum]|nr:MAG: hypothetical protein DI570_14745 [Phenylobacterium zucineum]